jgi:hypothetical protein
LGQCFGNKLNDFCRFKLFEILRRICARYTYPIVCHFHQDFSSAEHPTSNIQRRTSKKVRGNASLGVGCWMFVVGCFSEQPTPNPLPGGERVDWKISGFSTSLRLFGTLLPWASRRSSSNR